MRQFLHSLRARLVALVVLVALPGVAMLAVNAWKGRIEAIEGVQQQAIDTASLLASDQARLIEETRRYLERLAQFPEVQQPASPACSAFLAKVLGLTERYVNLGVPCADGELLCNALPLKTRVNVADRSYIRRALDNGEFSIGEFQTDRAAGVTSVNFAYPVVAPADGRVVGAAVAVISLSWWSERLAETRLPENSIAYIADADNRIVAHFPEARDRLGLKLGELNIQTPDADSASNYTVAVSKDGSGITRIFALMRLVDRDFGSPVFVGVDIPFDARMAAIESQAIKGALMLLFFVALMFVTAMWGVRVSILQPLEQLTRSTGALESGKHQYVAQFKGALELVRLQERFSRMARKRLETEKQLQYSKNYNRMLFETTPVGLALRSRDGRLLDVNPAFAAILGRTIAETKALNYRDIIEPERADDEVRQLERLRVMESCCRYEVDYRHRDGHSIPVRVSSMVLERGGERLIWSSVEDVTADKQAEASLRLAASVFTHAREGIFITDAEGRIVDANQTFCEITGYAREEFIGEPANLLGSGSQTPDYHAAMWRMLRERGHWYGEIWSDKKGGEHYAAMLTISSVRDISGGTTNYVALLTDITLMKAHEKQLEHIAHYDALSGLPNRVLLADRLKHAMAQSQRRGLSLAVAYLDLDGFKPVNDTHGHDVGDKLLNVLSDRMKDALRDGDTLARIGGDEFVAVLTDLHTRKDGEVVLDRMLQAVAEPVTVDGLVLRVSASIGVTLYPQDAAEAEVLMRHADQAMYLAKQAGKNRCHFFDVSYDAELKALHASRQAVREGFERGEFLLHYQPKVNLKTGVVVGLEALIRWQHPVRGLLVPDGFLPQIEDHVISVEVGEWVIDTVLSQLDAWRAAGLNLPVSVNVGARQLQQGDFVVRLAALLAAHPGVDPQLLELEIVETNALEDMEQVCELMHACLAMGVRFSLDDFGTGYSSLTYLRRLPAGLLKIDQSFVRDMLDDADDMAIVEGVVGLAAAFQRDVIAEGVETVAHGTKLLELGCVLAQGFGIARPMPSDAVLAWVASWRPDSAWNLDAPETGAGDGGVHAG
ncbi:MAG: EAL domain-containing protein [Azoarcus sp. PHD]|nr:MAG: EAL domain-containing protein [Azoarcus sp. PHD]